jgi:hypothetical protein
MSQKTHVYTVQDGDEVKPRFVGTKVELVNYTDPQEAINAGHFASLAVIMAAANRDRNIDANRAVRKVLSKPAEGESDADVIRRAVLAGNAIKKGEVTARTPATAKPKTVVKAAAADAGTRMFEKMLANPSFRSQMLDDGIADKATYDRWVAARTEAAKPQAPVAGNGAAQGGTQVGGTAAPATGPVAGKAGSTKPAQAGKR